MLLVVDCTEYLLCLYVLVSVCGFVVSVELDRVWLVGGCGLRVHCVIVLVESSLMVFVLDPVACAC